MNSIKKNFFFSTFLTISNYVFPLITYPYVSRVLQVERIGLCNFVDSIINYFILFSMLGISTYGIREIAKKLNIDENDLELYEKYKAKISENVYEDLKKNQDGKLVLVPEVMVVDNIVAGIIRKEKLSVSEIEDAIQSNLEKGSIGLINSIAELFVQDKITLEQAKAQIEEKNLETLNRTIMQLKIKKQID